MRKEGVPYFGMYRSLGFSVIKRKTFFFSFVLFIGLTHSVN